MNIVTILTKVLPIALQIVPLVEKLIGDSDGETKRATAVDLIVPAIQAVEAAAGRDLVDEEALAEYAGAGVDAVVGILNEVGVLGQSVTTAITE